MQENFRRGGGGSVMSIPVQSFLIGFKSRVSQFLKSFTKSVPGEFVFTYLPSPVSGSIEIWNNGSTLTDVFCNSAVVLKEYFCFSIICMCYMEMK